jgi:hypothetical protein
MSGYIVVYMIDRLLRVCVCRYVIEIFIRETEIWVIHRKFTKYVTEDLCFAMFAAETG